LAATLTRPEARVFYSVREVARHYRVSTSTISKVYARLERDGCLSRTRSSMTHLLARRRQPRVRIQGVIAVPVWIPGFLAFRDWRIFFIELEERLRQHSFVASFVHYHWNEANAPAFVDRLLAHHPDYVVWLSADPKDHANLHSLADPGVRLVVINS